MEREFGVPLAGEILDRSQWTQTAIKRLPDAGPLDFAAIFGREAPLVVDLGCGNGRFLISSSVWRPERNHIGVDILPLVIRYATRRANQRGLRNVRFAVSGGAEFLERYVAPGTAAEIHLYHPQPYYQANQVEKRLVTPQFLALVRRSLTPAGQFFIQTDNPGYWKYIRQVTPCFFQFEERSGPWLDAPKGRTRREIIALKRGLPVFRGSATLRPDLDEAEAQRLAEQLPPPTFNADRRLQQLDREERLGRE